MKESKEISSINKIFIIIAVLTISIFSVWTPISGSAKESDFHIEGSTLTSYTGNDKTVTVPGNVTKIGNYAFGFNSNVQKVILPKSVKEIDGYAFYDCVNLSTVTLSPNIKSIGAYAFSGTAIESFKCPKNLVILGECAFNNCKNLSDVKFNKKIRLIGSYAFSSTPWMSNLPCDDNGYRIKDNVLIKFDNSYYSGSTKIPSGVKVIAGNAMSYILASEIVIPNSVIAIGPDAFRDARSLKQINIPASVKYIGDKAFFNCPNLEYVDLPTNLTFKGKSLFSPIEVHLEKVTDSKIKEVTEILKDGRDIKLAIPEKYYNIYDEGTVQFIRDITDGIAKQEGLYCYIDPKECDLSITKSGVYDNSLGAFKYTSYCTLSVEDYDASVKASNEIKKKASVVKINSITSDAAKKIDTKLIANKDFILKIKTKESKFTSNITKLNEKLKEQNKAGVILRTSSEDNSYVSDGKKYNCVPLSKDGYVSLYISKETAKTYHYAINVINKIFDKGKKNAYSDSNYGSEYATAKKVLANAKCMNDLSDAMKVYAIATSGYFRGLSNKHNFNMVYSFNYSYDTDNYSNDSDLLRNLYFDKANGVCHDFAVYEIVLWSCLGIENWYNSSDELSHAWSVVKVSNSDGKKLLIPFDYDIGPHPRLSGFPYNPKDKTQLENRYAIYLNDIPGSNGKKNFTEGDFK